jgi:hypothetical protein
LSTLQNNLGHIKSNFIYHKPSENISLFATGIIISHIWSLGSCDGLRVRVGIQRPSLFKAGINVSGRLKICAAQNPTAATHVHETATPVAKESKRKSTTTMNRDGYSINLTSTNGTAAIINSGAHSTRPTQHTKDAGAENIYRQKNVRARHSTFQSERFLSLR